MPIMTTGQCFEAAVQVETLMRDVYVGLARRHADQETLCTLFRGLAEEEEQHAQRIRLLAKHQSEGTWARDAAVRITGKLDAISAELLGLVAELSDESRERSPRELLQRVIDAEHRCGAIHAEELARTAEIDVQLLFSALARQDVHHRSLLELGARPGDRRPPPLPRKQGPVVSSAA
jgi:rubrerythrin